MVDRGEEGCFVNDGNCVIDNVEEEIITMRMRVSESGFMMLPNENSQCRHGIRGGRLEVLGDG